MDNTVINTVSSEDISRIFDSVGVTSDVIGGTTKEEVVEGNEPSPITSEFSQDFTDFDTFVKPSSSDNKEEEGTTLVDYVDSKPKVIEEPKDKQPKENSIEGVVSYIDELIGQGVLQGFEDGEPIKKKEDIKALIEGNIQLAHEKALETAKEEILRAFPPELHQAAQYAMKGGTDMRGFFKAMSTQEEIKNLDVDTDEGAENVVRLSLQRQGFTSEEIDSEIFDLKDSGKLTSKAKLYKPKLDTALEKEIQAKIKEEEELMARREEGEKVYKNSVFEALKDGDINGVKINRKIQGMIFDGLTNSKFKSITGSNTNLLGALLEKIQFIEPDYKLLAEATWLLADPKGYREQIAKNTKEVVTADTVRQIKQASESSKSGSRDLDLSNSRPTSSGVKRSGFFKQL